MDNELVALSPGTGAVTDAMNFVALSEGSVPPSALQAALTDQLTAQTSDADKYIVYITDGNVDNEKSDVKGQNLPSGRIYLDDQTPECSDAVDSFELASTTLNDTLMWADPQMSELLHRSKHDRQIIEEPGHLEDHAKRKVRDLSGRTCGAKCQALTGDLDVFLAAQTAKTLVCKPIQTVRVVEACETARNENISMIAIDLTGDENLAEDIVDMCVNPEAVVSRTNENAADDMRRARSNGGSSDEKRVSRRGADVLLSVDGQSMSASVNDLEELRSVLATMMPTQFERQRTVRLVH